MGPWRTNGTYDRRGRLLRRCWDRHPIAGLASWLDIGIAFGGCI